MKRRLSLIHLCLARSYECCLPPHFSKLSSTFLQCILVQAITLADSHKKDSFFILPCRLYYLLLASASRRQFFVMSANLFAVQRRISCWVLAGVGEFAAAVAAGGGAAGGDGERSGGF